ncbi:Ig-like domain-containing protein [Massilia sp. S19_KUP03_FR1]|uniref:Ig-like domain-containing protein n=1 Tax=Massilia sp. S19_KUP03_FR1 TaxID=3025503 RepID=UPI002FCD7415
MNHFKRYTKTLLCSAALLGAALLAACGSGDQGRDPILGIPAATLVSVAVTPAAASIAIGATQQLTTTAVYTDGSARDVTATATWTSASTAIATVSAAGVTKGVNAGAAVVTATFEGKSGTAAITVLPAKLVSIAVLPATATLNIGTTLQYAVIGSFDNNTTSDITAASSFSAATPATATITVAGLATAKAQGTTSINATSGGLNASATLTVLPATVVSLALTPATTTFAVGATRQLAVAATYSDGTILDVSASSVYASAAPSFVSVSNGGLITGVAAGTSALNASFGGKTATAQATTTAAVTVSSIAVSPVTSTIAAGTTQQFTAVATYSDGTTSVITTSAAWKSSATAVATVLNTGVATGQTAGTTTITATAGSQTASGTLIVTVPPVLLSLALTPATTTLQVGATRQLAVTASYSNGTVTDVTAASSFVSANPAFVSITNGGLIKGIAAGSSALTASFGGQTANAQATTTAATVTSISVTPATASIAVGATQQFIAVATYSDGVTGVITNSAAWTSSNNGVAAVLATGLATGATAGATTITATLGAQAGSGNLTVTALPVPVTFIPVNLGSAASFAVLAGTALTNNSGGTTFITGDVGSPSQTTAPPVAPGYTNYQSGAILNNALADLQVAITDANSRNCDVTFPGNIDLGGLVLPPGVYCYAGTISITGTFAMSGPGVYIFRTALTLNSTANSVVALTNGATAANVTWVPVGPTTLGANSVFVGSILGKSAAITVGDNTTLQTGRVLSGAAVTLSNNQIAK